MKKLISHGREIVDVVKEDEGEAHIVWETLTQVNALKIVSKATNLLNAKTIEYLRTTPQGEVEWEHLYQLSPSSCPSARVQFESDPVVATHWIAVELPIKGEERPTYVTIRDGQRFFIDSQQRFLVIEGTDWFTSIDGPARGERPMTKYEIYVPIGK